MEIKDIFESLGYSGELDLNEFNQYVDGTFLKKSEIHKDSDLVRSIVGKRVGDINTQIAKLFDYKHADLREKSVEDTLQEIKERYESSYNELKQTSKQGKDKQLIDLQTSIEEKDKSIQDYKAANDELKGALEKLNDDMVSFKKNTTVSSLFNEVRRSIPLKENITEVERVGFEKMFNDKYLLDLDGEDLVIKDKSGNHIKGSKPGEFASVKEVYETELTENKLAKVNNIGKGNPSPNIQENPAPPKVGIFRNALG